MNRDEAILALKSGPEGVKKWNQWRAKMMPLPDLTNANLNDTDLRNVDLSGVDLRRTSLIRTNLCGADFRNANLAHASLVQAKLDGANGRGKFSGRGGVGW